MKTDRMNPGMGHDPMSSDSSHMQLLNHGAIDFLEAPMNAEQPYGMEHHAAYMAQGAYDPYGYSQKTNFMVHQGIKSQVFDPQGMYEMQSPTTMSDISMSPSPPPPPRVYKPCVVCSDKSSGYHYGVSSCEGCKGFFRRSVQKNMQYTCHKDKNCPINKVTRNRCQYCRLQKCYATGMSKEAVRNDRNKKKKPKLENPSSNIEEVTEDEQRVLQEILEAHRVTFPQIEEAVLSPMSCHDTRGDIENDEASKENSQNQKKEKSMLWDKVTELSSKGIIKIVEFAKKMPGFTSLSTSDQITLLKAACLEIMILRLCSRYDLDKDVMLFNGGLSLDREQLQKGGFGTLTDTIFRFASSLKVLNIDEMEYAVLSAICLISGDRSGLEESERVEQMQEPILEALKHYVRTRRKDQPNVFAKILYKLTDLRSISVKGAERVLHLRLEMPDELPPLIIEMLDRQENVCIP